MSCIGLTSHQSGTIMKIDSEKAYDRVQWNFLVEVLQRKGFHPTWIRWILQIVGGRVCVNVNGEGEQGKFFRTYRG